MEVYNSMKSISISEQIIPRKPLIAISSNKLKGKSLEKDESKNLYYESISKEILEYDGSIEEKNEKDCDNMEKDESLDNSDSGHQYKVTFLKWRNNSCRYDTFFYILLCY